MIEVDSNETYGVSFVDVATRQVLGVERVLEITSPDSEPARNQWFAPVCLTSSMRPDARQLFEARRSAQLRFESWWAGLPDEDREESRFRRALAQMPLDLDRVLNKVRAEEVLAESELFAIKRFLYHTSKLMALTLDGFEIDRASPQEDQRLLLDLLSFLHPEAEPSPRFHLSDSLSPALASVRKSLVNERRVFMTRRKALVTLISEDYPGVRFDLDGEANILKEQALRAATDPRLEPRGHMWRLRDDLLHQARVKIEALQEEVEHHEFFARQALSKTLRGHVSWLVDMLHAVTLFDLRLTRMRLRERIKGCWPTLSKDASHVVIRGGNSPLLQENVATPRQAIDFDYSRSPVVITGPNMGGKSSLLRLVGLCQWCMQHGLPVPARHYQAPLMRHVVYVGSDLPHQEQGTTADGLSSFGREIRRLVVCRQETQPVTLWLLDEVGRGTHPEDGTSLAMEILETLQQRGDHVVCATHFPRLTAMPDVIPWRIAGLVDREWLMKMAETSHPLSATASTEVLEELERALRASMDYRPVRLQDGEESVPRDAHLIARLLGW